MKIIESDQLCDRAVVIGDAIKARLRALQERGLDFIGDVRGPGAMIAMEIVKNKNPNQPDPELTKKIVQAAAAQGLLMLSCGLRSNVIRFLPALTAANDIIEEAMDRLEGVLMQINQV